LLQHIDHTQKNVVVGVIGILATLYTVLFFIVQHADHILQRQHGALQEARDELDMRVRERTAELVQANAQLERSNRELRDFAFVASHDLQEPLRKIQTFGDRLKVVCGEALSAQGHDYLERMRNAAGQMQTLIHGLRTFLQMTVTAQPFVPVDLSAMAHEVVSDLGQYIEQVGGHVDMGELPTIEAEPLQIRQLLQHLIDNALKFRQAETAPLVTIRGQRLQAGEQYVKGSAAAAEEWCQITVVDNGIGFDEKYLDRIFTVFQRLHGGDTYDGVGVGLAVCRKIVEHHGGAITAKSTPGEGATFIVTLPLTHSVGDHVECIPLADPVSF
ncbi:MAG TPA: ATP-binding protein, partial [Candidatus Tectomicrobia bacterium]